jgi:hypothetical protein
LPKSKGRSANEVSAGRMGDGHENDASSAVSCDQRGDYSCSWMLT